MYLNGEPKVSGELQLSHLSGLDSSQYFYKLNDSDVVHQISLIEVDIPRLDTGP